MQAQYSSRCPSCGERIEEGDDIFRDDELDAWVCEGCEPAPLRIIKPKPVARCVVCDEPATRDERVGRGLNSPVCEKHKKHKKKSLADRLAKDDWDGGE